MRVRLQCGKWLIFRWNPFQQAFVDLSDPYSLLMWQLFATVIKALCGWYFCTVQDASQFIGWQLGTRGPYVKLLFSKESQSTTCLIPVERHWYIYRIYILVLSRTDTSPKLSNLHCTQLHRSGSSHELLTPPISTTYVDLWLYLIADQMSYITSMSKIKIQWNEKEYSVQNCWYPSLFWVNAPFCLQMECDISPLAHFPATYGGLRKASFSFEDLLKLSASGRLMSWSCS